jgi:phospholipid transport system transporter-binding protein
VIIAGSNQITLLGPLTAKQVAILFAEGPPSFEGGNCDVNFSQVEMVDSSALGLLLSWLRAAQRAQAKLTLINVPQNLRSLAGAYGVAGTLSL